MKTHKGGNVFEKLLDWLSRSRVEKAERWAVAVRDSQWARATRATFFEPKEAELSNMGTAAYVSPKNVGYGVWLNTEYDTIRYDPANDSAGSPDIWSVP